MGAPRGRSRSPVRVLRATQTPQLSWEEVRHSGKVRWYNGRKQIGIIDGDNGQEFFIPCGGRASDQNLVPATAQGLVHGTRVSFREGSFDREANIMGAVDVRPLEELHQPGIECGVDTRIGGRPYNEDRLIATDLYDLGFLAGIFDGHGGDTCVDYVSQRYPQVLHAVYTAKSGKLANGVAVLSPEQEADLIHDAIVESFLLTDQEFLQAARAQKLKSGSTGLVILLAHGFEALPMKSSVAGCRGGVAKLFVGNSGDCRALLLSGRSVLRLSDDHKPERADETNRILQAGGEVIHCLHTGIHRVGRKTPAKDGGHRLWLSTSRCFGDLELKEPNPLVVVDPEVYVHTLEPDDWAVVIGCDGLFNNLTDQEVGDIVWHVMAVEGKGPIEAAREVGNRAEAAGSIDNITSFVMRFGWSDIPRVR